MYDFRLTNKGDPGYHLIEWWKSLDQTKGDRARLRRSLDRTVTVIPAFGRLTARLNASSAPTQAFLARIAVVASYVRELSLGNSFGTQLSVLKNGRPLYSDLRFRRLLSSGEAELPGRLMTAIHHVRWNCNLLDIANSLVDWQEARLRWARHYFGSTTAPAGADNTQEI